MNSVMFTAYMYLPQKVSHNILSVYKQIEISLHAYKTNLNMTLYVHPICPICDNVL